MRLGDDSPSVMHMHPEKTVLMVHHSGDLYGADRSLIASVDAVDPSWRIVVALAEDGPLASVLRDRGALVCVGPVLKLSRSNKTLRGALLLLAQARLSQRFLDECVGNARVVLVYSNSLAVLAGGLWALRRRVPHIWHVREIGRAGVAVDWLLWAGVRVLSTKVLCNSTETLRWIGRGTKESGGKYEVVWNGVEERPEEKLDHEARRQLRRELGAHDGELLCVLVGRINRWKGQDIALRAWEYLVESGVSNIRLTIVGSPPPQQGHYLANLETLLNRSPARERVLLRPFTPEIDRVWDACDVAIVPSTEPEPFGRVAAEAMAAGKPVIAAAHGGLLDIVQDGVTGFHVPPGDAHALAQAVLKLALSPAMRESMGNSGRTRQRQLFSRTAYVQKMHRVFSAFK